MNLLRLFISLILFLFFGCVEKKTQTLKEFYAQGIEEFIKKIQIYQRIESSLILEYESKEELLSGDASLKIYKNETFLRVYYMGFPAGEIHEKDEEVSSNLLIEQEKIKQIIEGIKKGFMWWNGDFEIIENEENFILKENDRIIFLSKDAFMPVKQSFTFEDQIILITYGDYKKVQTEESISLTMPSNITVYYRDRTLKIKVDSIKLKHG